MTLTRVMGTAFIRAYSLHNSAPPGPFVAVPECDRNRVPERLCIRCQLRLKISHFCRSKISHFERAVVPPDAVFGVSDLVEL